MDPVSSIEDNNKSLTTRARNHRKYTFKPIIHSNLLLALPTITAAAMAPASNLAGTFLACLASGVLAAPADNNYNNSTLEARQYECTIMPTVQGDGDPHQNYLNKQLSVRPPDPARPGPESAPKDPQSLTPALR